MMVGGAWWRQARYRWSQGWSALRPRIDPAERAAALRGLTPAARQRFERLPPALQCHHLTVHRRLRAAGHADVDLLAAALLHDIGKSDGAHGMRLWQRVAVVLAQRQPALVPALAQSSPGSWRYGFFVHVHHPELGARAAAALGCSERTVALIARHHLHDDADQALRALQWADDEA